MPNDDNLSWILGVTDYGPQRYISMIQKGNILATQFHPEKSGTVGLKILLNFLNHSYEILQNKLNNNHHNNSIINANIITNINELQAFPKTTLAKRIIACLDVRSNDKGDLVVTKGDQYDVRESVDDSSTAGR